MKNLNGFMKKQRALDKSANTIKAYEQDLAKWSEFITLDEDSLTAITLDQADELIMKLYNKYSVTTIRRMKSSLGSYCKYLRIANPLDGVEMPQQKRKEVERFNKEDVVKLISSIKSPRDKAMVALFVSAGLRKSELINLKLSDFDAQTGMITLRNTKREERSTIFISDMAVDYINSYIKNRKCESEFLFTSESNNSKGTPLTSVGAWSIIKKAYDKAGLSGDVHKLRHTTASLMADNGASAFDIKDHLRHTSVTTSQKYVALSEERKRSNVDRVGF